MVPRAFSACCGTKEARLPPAEGGGRVFLWWGGRELAPGPTLLRTLSALLQVLPQGTDQRAAGLGVYPVHQADTLL